MTGTTSSSLGLPILQHIAIIMDGNGRWARRRGMPRTFGHKYGVDAARRTVWAAKDLGIKYLTLFGFSSENWQRPEEEVTELMGLLRRFLRSEVADLHKEGARLRVIGDRSRLANDIVTLIQDAETLTKDNDVLHLTIALSYGGRGEIMIALKKLAEQVVAGQIDPSSLDEKALEQNLETKDLPDPDLIIRTSGEKRLSNFLLWQSAYSELVFTDVLWPDFDKQHLEAAIEEFMGRDRRYGAKVG